MMTFSPRSTNEARQFPHHLPVNGGLEGEVELLKGLHPRKARKGEAELGPLAVEATPFGLKDLRQEHPEAEVLSCRRLPDRVELRR
jgi:hypothetical protein